MAPRFEFYKTEEEREAYLVNATVRGETMIHDDFNIGPEGTHRLTFDVKPDPPQRERTVFDALRDRFRQSPGDLSTRDVVEYIRKRDRLE